MVDTLIWAEGIAWTTVFWCLFIVLWAHRLDAIGSGMRAALGAIMVASGILAATRFATVLGADSLSLEIVRAARVAVPIAVLVLVGVLIRRGAVRACAGGQR